MVIEDLGMDKAKCLVDDLKIWADPWYNFPAETKGGQIMCAPDVVCVTTNYHINDLDIRQVDKEALLRRFEVIVFKKLM